MTRISSAMTALELFEATEAALAIAGLPEYPSVDSPDYQEQLKFFQASDRSEEDTWALVSVADDGGEFVAIDTQMAYQLVLAHLRDWLMVRGWQVQVHCFSSLQRWTLVDCLSVTDGGGDRLDVDYPYGEDSLMVTVASVIAVNTVA